jgi:hypothetical protein
MKQIFITLGIKNALRVKLLTKIDSSNYEKNIFILFTYKCFITN